MKNRIVELLGIEIPVIQAGMVWASGWKLASAVSNAGGLGIIGAGSMHPPTLDEHLRKCREATPKPFGVNLPLLYPEMQEHLRLIVEHKVPIVFTSAGNPKTYTPFLKEHGIIVVHVVSSSAFAKKAEAAGCDAIVAEGFEAGGHNGREETTTMVLIPAVCKAVSIPVIAAGGIANGAQMAAALCLGAEAVQVGSRFVATHEASSHQHFKDAVVNAAEGDTMLMMKDITPVRLLKNRFYEEVKKLEEEGISREDRIFHLGKGRAKQGMFLGNLDEGELEIGQAAALIQQIKPAAEVVKELWEDCQKTLQEKQRQFADY